MISKRSLWSSVIMYKVPPSELAILLASSRIISNSFDISFSLDSANPIFDKFDICFSRSDI